MAFPIKSHLPLITTRIEFNFNLLPHPTQITTRRDFGAHVRRRARQSSVPYSRPKASEHSSASARSIEFEWSESELSDEEESTDQNNAQSAPRLIPKPEGEAGKVNSGGYNLERALGWTRKHYENFSDHIKAEVADKLNVKKSFTHQKAADLEKIIQSTAQKFGIENTYVNNWPIREALKARLKYTSDWEKKKEARKVQTELNEVLKPFKGKEKGKEDA